ncbi:hypothetical protein K4K60_002935 [Colletotrichum sp. SAR11_57]|nr:hypothetical protein K4K60_002935 [Colletotrichum sp. SAR11_57]
MVCCCPPPRIVPILIVKHRTYQIASEVQGEGQLGEPTPALCHTGAGVNMVISEDKNAEVEVETIIKTV